MACEKLLPVITSHDAFEVLMGASQLITYKPYDQKFADNAHSQFNSDTDVISTKLVCLLLLSLLQFFWEGFPLGFDMLPQNWLTFLKNL